MLKSNKLKFIDQIIGDPLLFHTIISLFFGAVFALIILLLNQFSNPRSEIIIFILIIALGFSVASFLSFRIVRISEKRHLIETDKIFAITSETLAHLRHGLNAESAAEVAKIIARMTDSSVVAITDKTRSLACEGNFKEGFVSCLPKINDKTVEAIKEDSIKVLSGNDEIGCPNKEDCLIQSGIIVPLHLKKAVVGTLKFYYEDKRAITVDKIAFANGIANLLSTQLELSEIEYQTTLAFKAQLRALQAQINPHFLFNTLNTIAMFCRTKPIEARRLLLEFSAFFRKSLERTEDLITFKEELEYVNQYLVFEKARFGNGLEIVQEVDPSSLSTKMPALTLQPIVENAIRHGFPTESRPLSVEIKSKIENDSVVISIKDNGSGIKKRELDKIFVPGFGRGLGIGLSNVNDRLSGLYGEKFIIDVNSKSGAGTVITLKIPLNGGKVSAA